MNICFARLFGLGEAIAIIASSSAAVACGGGNLLFADGLVTLMTNVWGPANDNMSVKNGQLVISETDGQFYTDYESAAFGDVDYCVDVTLTGSSDETASYGGINFWSSDDTHFYTFQITLDGYATVRQYANGNWTFIIDDREFDAIKLGPGAANEVRVVTSGPQATFYVNDVKFDAITDTTAPTLSHFGFTVEAPAGGQTTFAYNNVAVRESKQN
jgi:hypothetical protein